MSDILLNPQLDMHGRRVLAPVKFKNKNEYGDVVQSTAPLPALEVEETKYYHNSAGNVQMHRPDGKKIAFVNGICATNLYWDQVYLDTEIQDGHTNLSFATQAQIDTYKFAVNPKAAIREQIEAEVAASLEVKIENKLRKKMGMEPREGTVFEEDEPEVGSTTDEQKIAGVGIGTVADKLNAVRNRNASVSEVSSPAPLLQGIASTASSENKAGSA